MWYKLAKQKFNIYGLPISGDFTTVKEFASELDPDQDGLENVETSPETPVVEIEDPTPTDEITQEDIDNNLKILETDPTANMKLPPLHTFPDPQCYCKIETRPILSKIGINDGRRVWIVNHFREDGSRIDNCPICITSADAFNKAEIQRLLNKGIDINAIPV